MQDKFWTPELWCEFLEGYSISSGMDILKSAEQFKSSKSPKREWEIVAYRVRDKNVYYTEYTDDIGRIWGNAEFIGGYIDTTDVNHPDCKIFSVRRLSDGEVFSVGDRIRGFGMPISAIEITDEFSGGLTPTRTGVCGNVSSCRPRTLCSEYTEGAEL